MMQIFRYLNIAESARTKFSTLQTRLLSDDHKAQAKLLTDISMRIEVIL
jgi:hypothetical protein